MEIWAFLTLFDNWLIKMAIHMEKNWTVEIGVFFFFLRIEKIWPFEVKFSTVCVKKNDWNDVLKTDSFLIRDFLTLYDKNKIQEQLTDRKLQLLRELLLSAAVSK